MNCSYCQQPVEYSYRVVIEPDGTKYCAHDSGNIGSYYELATGKWSRRTRAEREKYAKDLLQPINRDGTPNKHFEKVYGKPKPWDRHIRNGYSKTKTRN